MVGNNNLVSWRRFDAGQLQNKVAELTQWDDIPHLDEAFVQQNLKHLAALKMISPPVLATISAA